MTASYWVIREGNVRGQGRYFGYGRDGGRTWFGSRCSTDPFGFAQCFETRREAECWLQFIAAHRGSNGERIRDARIVKVVPKPKPDMVSADDAEAACRNARAVALEEAENICRHLAKQCYGHDPDGFAVSMHLADAIADAIAALRGGAK